MSLFSSPNTSSHSSIDVFQKISFPVLPLLTGSVLLLSTQSAASTFGVQRLEQTKLSTPTLPEWKLKTILEDKAVQKVTGTIFAWVDLDNKKVHIFSRKTNQESWVLQQSLRTNPGVKTWSKKQKKLISLTPVGNYVIADQGKYRESKAYNNAPMPFYSRLWDASQKPTAAQSGIFFHVGKLNDAGSHGCVRLNDKGAKYIQKSLKRGDHVFIRSAQ